jgi:hypothetical protein
MMPPDSSQHLEMQVRLANKRPSLLRQYVILQLEVELRAVSPDDGVLPLCRVKPWNNHASRHSGLSLQEAAALDFSCGSDSAPGTRILDLLPAVQMIYIRESRLLSLFDADTGAQIRDEWRARAHALKAWLGHPGSGRSIEFAGCSNDGGPRALFDCLVEEREGPSVRWTEGS